MHCSCSQHRNTKMIAKYLGRKEQVITFEDQELELQVKRSYMNLGTKTQKL